LLASELATETLGGGGGRGGAEVLSERRQARRYCFASLPPHPAATSLTAPADRGCMGLQRTTQQLLIGIITVYPLSLSPSLPVSDSVSPHRRADFHRAMVATAPGEKLLIGRAPPYEELDRLGLSQVSVAEWLARPTAV